MPTQGEFGKYIPTIVVRDELQQCSKCMEFKPQSEFTLDKRNSTGRCGWCQVCLRAYQKSWRIDPEGALKRKISQQKKRLSYYKLTETEYEDLMASQDHRCAVCGTDNPGGAGAWHIDHDHSCCPGRQTCGKCIRGILCAPCNLVLGLIGESSDALLAMVSYLESYAA